MSLARARQAFQDIEFHPAILRDVSDRRHRLGRPRPARRTALRHRSDGVHPADADRRGTRGRGRRSRRRHPVRAVHLGTTTIEDVAAAAGASGRNWFQLYMWKDRDRSMALVDRAANAGCDTLLVTVDAPVAGARLRDKRNGFSIPPGAHPGTVLDASPRPAWWFNFLTTEPLSFASLSSWPGTVAELLDTMFDPTVSYEDLRWIVASGQARLSSRASRHSTTRNASPAGVDAITLSNHGGRQLDRAPDTLPPAARGGTRGRQGHRDPR